MSTVTRYVMLNPYARAPLLPAPYTFTSGLRISRVTCQSAPYGQKVEEYLINWSNALRSAYELHRVDLTAHTAADATNTITNSAATTTAGACTLINEIRTKYNAHRIFVAAAQHAFADTIYDAGTATPPNATDEESLFALLEWTDRAFMRHRLALNSAGTAHAHAVSDDWTNAVDCLTLQGYKTATDAYPYLFSSSESTTWIIPETDKLDLGSVGFVLDFTTKIPYIYNRLEMILYAKVEYEDISGSSVAQVGSITPIQSLVGVYTPTSGPGGL